MNADDADFSSVIFATIRMESHGGFANPTPADGEASVTSLSDKATATNALLNGSSFKGTGDFPAVLVGAEI